MYTADSIQQYLDTLTKFSSADKKQHSACAVTNEMTNLPSAEEVV